MAYEAQDMVSLGEGNQAVPFVFGCQTSMTQFFQDQAENGIMGLSPEAAMLFTSLVETSGAQERVLAICLEDEIKQRPLKKLGGSMTVGGYDTSSHLTTLGFTDLRDSEGLYLTQIVSCVSTF